MGRWTPLQVCEPRLHLPSRCFLLLRFAPSRNQLRSEATLNGVEAAVVEESVGTSPQEVSPTFLYIDPIASPERFETLDLRRKAHTVDQWIFRQRRLSEIGKGRKKVDEVRLYSAE